MDDNISISTRSGPTNNNILKVRFRKPRKNKKKLDIDDFVFRIYELIRLVSVFPKVVRLTMVNRQRRHRIVLIQHVRTRV